MPASSIVAIGDELVGGFTLDTNSHWMAERLRLLGYPVKRVTQIRDKLSVQLVEKILFDSGKAEIKPQGKDVLGKVGQVLLQVKDKQIRIEGYTDAVPIGAALRQQFPTNWELSAQRATTVLRFLEEKAGVEGKYLSAVGYGPFRPVASNDTPEGKAENRRIEIVLTPLDVTEVLKELR